MTLINHLIYILIYILLTLYIFFFCAAFHAKFRIYSSSKGRGQKTAAFPLGGNRFIALPFAITSNDQNIQQVLFLSRPAAAAATTRIACRKHFRTVSRDAVSENYGGRIKSGRSRMYNNSQRPVPLSKSH
jgi:hypothetical protein